MRRKINHFTYQFLVDVAAVVVFVFNVVIVLSLRIPKIAETCNKLTNFRHFIRVKRVNPNVLISLLEDKSN